MAAHGGGGAAIGARRASGALTEIAAGALRERSSRKGLAPMIDAPVLAPSAAVSPAVRLARVFHSFDLAGMVRAVKAALAAALMLSVSTGCHLSELGQRFEPAPPPADGRPIVYLFGESESLGAKVCDLRIHAPDGTYSVELRDGGYLPFVTTPGLIDFWVRAPAGPLARGSSEFQYATALEVEPNRSYFVSCQVWLAPIFAPMEPGTSSVLDSPSNVWTAVDVVEAEEALAALRDKREMQPAALTAW